MQKVQKAQGERPRPTLRSLRFPPPFAAECAPLLSNKQVCTLLLLGRVVLCCALGSGPEQPRKAVRALFHSCRVFFAWPAHLSPRCFQSVAVAEGATVNDKEQRLVCLFTRLPLTSCWVAWPAVWG